MPDASGNFRGIAVPALPWEKEDELETLAMAEQAPETRAWEEARKAAALRAFQKETRWAGTD